MHLHEITVIHDRVDDLVHVVGFVRVRRNDVVQVVIHAGDVVGASKHRRFLHVVLRDEGDETANFCQCLFLGLCHEMRHARLAGVNLGTTELLNGHILARNGFHHLRAGDEHIRVLLGHHDEVGQRGAVHGATGTRTEDNADLRYDTRSQNITLENLCVAG